MEKKERNKKLFFIYTFCFHVLDEEQIVQNFGTFETFSPTFKTSNDFRFKILISNVRFTLKRNLKKFKIFLGNSADARK